MGTVMRVGGLRVVVFTHDHLPAHVHVVSGSDAAVFDLNAPAGPMTLRSQRGFTARDIKCVGDALNANLAALCEAWEKIHGAV